MGERPAGTERAPGSPPSASSRSDERRDADGRVAGVTVSDPYVDDRKSLRYAITIRYGAIELAAEPPATVLAPGVAGFALVGGRITFIADPVTLIGGRVAEVCERIALVPEFVASVG